MAVKASDSSPYLPWPLRLALARHKSGPHRRQKRAADPVESSVPVPSQTKESLSALPSNSKPVPVAPSVTESVTPSASPSAVPGPSPLDASSGDVDSLPYSQDEILPSFSSSTSHPLQGLSSALPSDLASNPLEISPTRVHVDSSKESTLTARLGGPVRDGVVSLVTEDTPSSLAHKATPSLQISNIRPERSASVQNSQDPISRTTLDSSQLAPSTVQGSTSSSQVPIATVSVTTPPTVPNSKQSDLITSSSSKTHITQTPPSQITTTKPPTTRQTPPSQTTTTKPPTTRQIPPSRTTTEKTPPSKEPSSSVVPPLVTGAGGSFVNMSGAVTVKPSSPTSVLPWTTGRLDVASTTGAAPLPVNPSSLRSSLALAIALPVVIFLFLCVILVAAIVIWRWRHIRKKTGDRDGDLWIENAGYDLSPSLQRQRDLADTKNYVADDSISVNGSPREVGELYRALYQFDAEDQGQLPLEEGETIVEVVEKLDTGWWRGITDDQEGWFPATFVEPFYEFTDDPGLTNEGFEGDSFVTSDPATPRSEVIYDQPMVHLTGDQIVPADVPIVPDISNQTGSVPPGHQEDSLDPLQTTDEMSIDPQQERWKTALKEVLLRIKKDPEYWAKLMNRSGGDGRDDQDSDGESNDDTGSDVGHSDMDSDSVSDFDDDMDGDLTGIEYRALYAFQPQQEGDLEFEEGDTVVVFEILDSGWWRGCCKEREGWLPGNYVQVIPQSPTSEDSGFTSILKKDGGITMSPHSPDTPSSGFETGGRGGQEMSGQANLQSSVDSSVPSTPVQHTAPLSPSNPAQQDGVWKPEVPRRYITPKLRVVKVPKKSLHRWAGHKPKKRPAPPPPSHPPLQTVQESASPTSVSMANGIPGGLTVSSSSLNRSTPSLVGTRTNQPGSHMSSHTSLPHSSLGSQTSLNRSKNLRQQFIRNRPARPRAPPPPRPKRPPPPVPTHKDRNSPGRSLNSLPRESPFKGQVSPAVSSHSLDRNKSHLSYMSTPVVGGPGHGTINSDIEMHSIPGQSHQGRRTQREESPYATTALFAMEKEKTPSTEPLTVAWDGTPLSQMERVSPLGAEDSGPNKFSVVPSDQFKSHNQSPPLMTSSPRDDFYHDKERPIVAVKPNLKDPQLQSMSPIPSSMSQYDLDHSKDLPAPSTAGSPSLYIPQHQDVIPDFVKPPREEEDHRELPDITAIPPPSEFSDYQSEPSRNEGVESETSAQETDIAGELRNVLNRRRAGAKPSQLRKSLSVDTPYANGDEVELTLTNSGPVLSRSAGSADQLDWTGDELSYRRLPVSESRHDQSDQRDPNENSNKDYVIRTPSALGSGHDVEKPKPSRKAPKPPTAAKPSPSATLGLQDSNSYNESDVNIPSTPFYNPQNESQTPDNPGDSKPPPPPRLVPSPFQKQAPYPLNSEVEPTAPRNLYRPQKPHKPPRRCMSHDPSQMNGHGVRLNLETPHTESKSTPVTPTDQEPGKNVPSRPPPPKVSSSNPSATTSQLLRTKPQLGRSRSHTDSIISLDSMPGSKKRTTLRRASQNYTAQRDGELSFSADSFIKEIGQAPGRQGWMVGMLSDGTIGYYPHSHVKDIYSDLMQSQV